MNSYDPYRNINNRRLTIVSGALPEDIDTATGVAEILERDYHLQGISLITSRQPTRDEKKKSREIWPIYYESFSDGEVRFEGGARALKDFFYDAHVVYVKHFLTPLAKQQHAQDSFVTVSPNDNICELAGFGSVMRQITEQGIATPSKITVAAPYLPYIRSHSFAKHNEGGFYQANTLEGLFVNTLSWSGVNEVIGIDVHSMALEQILEKKKIEFQNVNPFKVPGRRDWRLYPQFIEGLSPEQVIEKLTCICPFAEILRKEMPNYKKIALVALDDGSYARTRDFAFDTGLGLHKVIDFSKIRFDEGESILSDYQWYSFLRDEDISGVTFFPIDDMVATSKTLINASIYLKKFGAAGVIALASHNVGTDPQLLAAAESIDKVYLLDTVRNYELRKLTYLSSSKDLLANCICKSHNNLIHGKKLLSK